MGIEESVIDVLTWFEPITKRLNKISYGTWTTITITSGIILIGLSIYHKGMYEVNHSFFYWFGILVAISTIYPLKKFREERMAGKKKKTTEGMAQCEKCNLFFTPDDLVNHMEEAHKEVENVVVGSGKLEEKEETEVPEGEPPYSPQQFGDIRTAEICNLLYAILEELRAKK